MYYNPIEITSYSVASHGHSGADAVTAWENVFFSGKANFLNLPLGMLYLYSKKWWFGGLCSGFSAFSWVVIIIMFICVSYICIYMYVYIVRSFQHAHVSILLIWWYMYVCIYIYINAECACVSAFPAQEEQRRNNSSNVFRCAMGCEYVSVAQSSTWGCKITASSTTNREIRMIWCFLNVLMFANILVLAIYIPWMIREPQTFQGHHLSDMLILSWLKLNPQEIGGRNKRSKRLQ